jgi:hypothetical protein
VGDRRDGATARLVPSRRATFALAAALAVLAVACGGGDAESTVGMPGPPGGGDRSGVAGRVTGPDGAPLEGVSVAAASRDRPERPTPQLGVITNADGRYRWPLPPGRWEFTVDAPAYRAASRTVDVPAGRTVTVDFRLEH